jgi:Protein of unknown function (DUF2795)
MIQLIGHIPGGQRFRQTVCDSHGQADAVSVESYIKGMDYPCSKVMLIDLACLRHAPCDIIFLLRRMLQVEFDNPVEVGIALGLAGRQLH